jgi:hypothetical protein
MDEDKDNNEDKRADDERRDDEAEHTRQGGGGGRVPADDPLDRSVTGEKDAAEKATPPTEGPAAAGGLPG